MNTTLCLKAVRFSCLSLTGSRWPLNTIKSLAPTKPHPGLISQEKDWWTVDAAYVVTRNLTLAVGYGHFGQVLNHQAGGLGGSTKKWEFESPDKNQSNRMDFGPQLSKLATQGWAGQKPDPIGTTRVARNFQFAPLSTRSRKRRLFTNGRAEQLFAEKLVYRKGPRGGGLAIGCAIKGLPPSTARGSFWAGKNPGLNNHQI